MQDANYIAKCLIHLASLHPENDITNMKIQKLLYYAQGTHLALTGERLFPQEIEKWQYGPVVSDVYHNLKEFGSSVIELPKPVSLEDLSESEMKTLNMVYEYFGQFSAIRLMNLTHNETPWNSVEMGEIIPQDSITKFFDTIVVKGDE